jgi:multiple sugar transport system permease protein
VGTRSPRIAIATAGALIAAAYVAVQAARGRQALARERELVAADAAAAVRRGLARGEGASTIAARFGASRGYRVRVLLGSAALPALLDSLRRDEAPRAAGAAAVAPLKDADDWEVVGVVEVAPSPGAERGRSLLRRGVVLPLGLLAAACLWLMAWAGRVPPRRRRETAAAWAFLGVPLAHLAVFSFVPVGFTVYLAFHAWGLVEPQQAFVGLANFRELAADGLFWRTIGNTALYVLYVPITMAAGVGLALLLNRGRGGERALRAIVFLPYVTSMVAIAIVWQWMFNADFGLVNYGLRLLHLPAVDWLGSPRFALLSIIAVTVWTQVGYQMVIFLAGLQGIPQAYYDAALVDGATPWQRFRHVTLPLLKPVILFVLVTGIIAGFQVFTLVYMMTEGGPLHATDVIVYRIYQTAWEFLRFGSASAMSLVLVAILLVVTVIQFRLLGKRVEFV